ncbi:MAG: hypothetical protein WBP61_05975 [Nocardioides sp.]
MTLPSRLAPPAADPSLDHVAALLEHAARLRREQLSDLPPELTPVAAAHRASVTRILSSILAAQERLASGTYGTCVGCEHPIDDRSLRLRPWTDLCDRCIRR